MVNNEVTTDDLFDEVDDQNNEQGNYGSEEIDSLYSNENDNDDDDDDDDNDNGEDINPEDYEVNNDSEGEILSGVEKYLADYGIIGGQIQYEDGEFSAFNNLSSDEQYNILQSLSTEARPTIEDDYDLDEKEINLLNDIRNSEMSVEDFMGELINGQVRQSMTVRDSMGIDYRDMPDDAIYMKWLREVSPEMTEEAAIENLESQLRNPELFQHQANQLRGQYMQMQQNNIKSNQNAADKQQFDLIESDRYQIVETVEGIDNIGGAEINDQMKNEVLHSLLEINDQGDPLIMEEMFSDPEKLFKAAWFMKYGEGYLENVDRYWKRRESESYKRGRSDILDGAPSTTRGMSRNNVVPRPGRNTVNSPGSNKTNSMDALWDD
ncbi:MAG: hypothetical protein KAH32_04665 [Chlamydiia bacterium]|nr:hypothetical protein [Chlamydiia bacterium]